MPASYHNPNRKRIADLWYADLMDSVRNLSVRELHDRLQVVVQDMGSLMTATIEKVHEAGAILSEAKAAVGHGAFRSFLDRHGIGERTARNWMSVARKPLEELKRTGADTLRKALKANDKGVYVPVQLDAVDEFEKQTNVDPEAAGMVEPAQLQPVSKLPAKSREHLQAEVNLLRVEAAKVHDKEKTIMDLTEQRDNLLMDADDHAVRRNHSIVSLQEKVKILDHKVMEWQTKAGDLQRDLDAAQRRIKFLGRKPETMDAMLDEVKTLLLAIKRWMPNATQDEMAAVFPGLRDLNVELSIRFMDAERVLGKAEKPTIVADDAVPQPPVAVAADPVF